MERIQRAGGRPHPLDPLSARELASVTAVLRAHEGFATLGERTRFVTIALREPPKAAVLAWADGRRAAAPRGRGGDPRPRRRVLDRGRRRVRARTRSSAWTRRTDIQPMAVVTELMEAEELVRLDPAFRAAMQRRGIADLDAIQVDAWPAGHFGEPDDDGRQAEPLRRLRQAAPGRQRVGPPDRRRDRVRRPQPPRGAARRRPRRRADPARERQLRCRRRRAAARRHRGARDHPARRPWIHARRPRALVAALAGARRLHAARGARAQPARLRGRRPAALDPLPRVALGDGRALRRPEPDALLEERLRRRRERRRRRRLAAHARLRLPRRDRLPRRARLRRRRRRRCRSRTRSASTRRTSACSGATSSGATARARCAARAGS